MPNSPPTLLALLPSLAGGGSERVLLALLRHIDPRRFSPALAIVDGRCRDLAAELPAGVEVLDLHCTRVRYAVPAVLRLLRHRRPQIVLSTLGHLNLMLALVRPLLPSGMRFIGRESSIVSASLAQARPPWLWRWAYRRLYPRLDLVICQSRAMQADLCSQFGFPQARTRVIHNPLDLDCIRQLANQDMPQAEEASPAIEPALREPVRRLLAVGRLSPEKGFDALLDAVAACKDLPLRLDLLGQGPQEAMLRHRVGALGLAGRVRLRGFVANPYPWLQRADALVLSSYYEGMPNVVLEALACGTPVITTPVPSALEILEHVPGNLVAAGFDSASLAAALREWCARPLVRVAPGAMTAYDVAHVTRRYEEALSDAFGL